MPIRRFRESDAPRLAAIFHAAVHGLGSRHHTAAQCAAWSPAPPSPALYLDRAATRTLLVAAGDDDVPCAYADLEEDGHIDHLYCHPDAAGAGAGGALIDAIERMARAAGTDRLFVEASEGARALFERRGFVLVRLNDLAVRGVAIHNVSLEKRLAPAG